MHIQSETLFLMHIYFLLLILSQTTTGEQDQPEIILATVHQNSCSYRQVLYIMTFPLTSFEDDDHDGSLSILAMCACLQF